MNKQTTKRRVAHGSPLPTASPTPRTHDRWLGIGGKGRWTAGCGCRFNDYYEHLEHQHKRGGV